MLECNNKKTLEDFKVLDKDSNQGLLKAKENFLETVLNFSKRF